MHQFYETTTPFDCIATNELTAMECRLNVACAGMAFLFVSEVDCEFYAKHHEASTFTERRFGIHQ